MNQFKRAQVIMLPTENTSNIFLAKKGLSKSKLIYHPTAAYKYYEKDRDCNQHLYIISDDEIKEGDWYYNSRLNQIFQSIRKSGYSKKTDDYKVIATTDTSLTKDIRMLCKSCKGSGGGFSPKCITCKGNGIRIENDLSPQPSQQFIEKYIESYNRGKIITDVLVEYEEVNIGPDLTKSLRYYPDNLTLKLKVNPKDNTITIKKLKDSWNREEIVELLHKLNNDSYKYLNYKDLQNVRLTKWIEVNL